MITYRSRKPLIAQFASLPAPTASARFGEKSGYFHNLAAEPKETPLVDTAVNAVPAIPLPPKTSGLTMALQRSEGALASIESTFDYFSRRYGFTAQGWRSGTPGNEGTRKVMEEGEEYVISGKRFRNQDTAETYALLLLAFLDAMGYAQRSQRKEPLELFEGILQRYIHCCKRIQAVRNAQAFNLGNVVAKQSDARSLDLTEKTVDAVLFSPP